MNKYMDVVEALELVELRITEDSISWAEGVKEYCRLTGMSLAGCFSTAQYLRKKYSKNDIGDKNS